MKILKCEDIKIKSMGAQLREFITSKMTIKELAKKFEMSSTTVNNYLRMSTFSDKFRLRFLNCFGAQLEEFIKMPEEQILNFLDVFEVHERMLIREEVQAEQLINAVVQLLHDYDMSNLQYRIDRIWAWHYFLKREIDEGIRHMNNAIEKAENRSCDYYIKYRAELALFYLEKERLDTADSMIKALIDYAKDKECADFSYYSMHYVKGLIELNLKRYKKAEENFDKALEYSFNSALKGRALIEKGHGLAMDGETDRAMKCYRDAVDVLEYEDQVDYGKTFVYIAELYLKMGNKEKALEFAKIALQNITPAYVVEYGRAYNYYVEALGCEKEIVNEIINKLISMAKDDFDSHWAVFELDVMVTSLIKCKNRESMLKVKEMINVFLNNKRNSTLPLEARKQLESCGKKLEMELS